jgi:tripartite-type tricarboxylate transporter receptor subunit TctC
LTGAGALAADRHRSPNVLVAHPSVPVQSVKDLVSAARDKPEHLNYASSGVGSGGHLSMELLQRMARIKLIHVPYKGAGAATAAVVAGQTQFARSDLNTMPGLPTSLRATSKRNSRPGAP